VSRPPAAPDADIGMGVVGCGGAAVDLCRAIDATRGAHLAGVFDPRADAAAALARPRGARIHDELAGLLADPRIDAVYVAVPHDLLEPTADRALRAGHHVLVEKPMALDVTGIERLAQSARAVRRALGVMFELREIGAVRAARDLVTSGAIGAVRSVRIRTVIDKPADYWSAGPTGRVVDDWRARIDRAGGGVVLMNSIHQIDLVRFLTGLEFVRAAAEIATLAAPIEVEDAATASLVLSNGALVSLTATAHSPGATLEERIELDGTDGRIDLPDPYGDGSLRIFVRRAAEGLDPGVWSTRVAERGDPYARTLAGFLAAVRRGVEAPIGAADAAAAMAVVGAIYRSAATGRSEPALPPTSGRA
jgi:predicted dehydrogenase